MKQAVKQAEAKVLSPAECQNKTVKEVLSTSRDALKVMFTDGTQLIISAIQNHSHPEILIRTRLTPLELVHFGLLDKSYLKEILRTGFETRKTCLERQLRQVEDELTKL